MERQLVVRSEIHPWSLPASSGPALCLPYHQNPSDSPSKVVFLGPRASGQSPTALRLARIGAAEVDGTAGLFLLERAAHSPAPRRAADPLGPARTVAAHFKERLEGAPAIEAVYARFDGGVLYVWVVLSSMDRETEDRVFDAEGSTLDAFSAPQVELAILYRQGTSQALLPSGAVAV